MKQNIYVIAVIGLIVGLAVGGWLGATGRLPFHGDALSSSANLGTNDICGPGWTLDPRRSSEGFAYCYTGTGMGKGDRIRMIEYTTIN